jgi:4-hydroxy-tetrahydrodipicolinate reductase
MKIALIGYGKMGKAIEKIAIQRGHEIVLKISVDNLEDFTPENLKKADVAIEFTGPHSAFDNINVLLSNHVPVVSGSTGWLEKLPQIVHKTNAENGAFLYASNFSVGVNIFFAINKKLAALMNEQSNYDVRVHEVHHTEKKDAPSGTAITLAEQILEEVKRKQSWTMDQPASNQLQITAERIDPAPGTHTITYSSAIDDIEITHTAHNREGFATGAVLAAEFLHNKKGIYSMSDVLGI